MNVLVACEFSGIVRDAFRAAGHNAWSCDLLPSEAKEGGHHWECDARHILSTTWQTGASGWRWDLLIAHPPCTYLCNSGVRWLKDNEPRWQAMYQAAEFFRTLLDADVPHIAVENPIIHKYAAELIGRRQDQIIQPWQFGHGETKAICWWLKNLPPLEPTNIVPGRTARVHRAPPSPDRWKTRSRFYPGIAKAIAQQWTQTT